jgi:hypothetical protein
MNTEDIEKRRILVPTMKLRWGVCKVVDTETVQTLQQWWNDISVLNEDGTPADGVWLDVPVEYD